MDPAKSYTHTAPLNVCSLFWASIQCVAQYKCKYVNTGLNYIYIMTLLSVAEVNLQVNQLDWGQWKVKS